MNNEITVESGDDMKVFTESIAQKTFIVQLEKVILRFSRRDLEELNEKIDSVLWDESRNELGEQITELRVENDRLQEIIDDAGATAEDAWEG